MQDFENTSESLDAHPGRRAMLAGVAGIAAGALLTRGAKAGPLDPPAGPISGTYKTLTQVEPRIAINATNTPGDSNSIFRISQPGSYYLTENLVGQSGKRGIEIASRDVTIDLMGFSLRGVPGSLAAITTDDGHESIIIRNGVIRDWGTSGISLHGGGIRSCALIEGVTALYNGADGFLMNRSALVRDCVAYSNAGSGFGLSEGCIVTNCSARGNNQVGFWSNNPPGPAFGCVFTGCAAVRNGGVGFVMRGGGTAVGCVALTNGGAGFSLSEGSILTDCSARDNDQAGFIGNASAPALSCVLTRCSAFQNGNAGISLGTGSSVIGCVATSNGASGIKSGLFSRITDCTCESNATHGLEVGQNSNVSGCVCVLNGTDGIRGSNECTIRDNSCSRNTNHGISVFHDCMITNNLCVSNGTSTNGAGIHVNGFGSCIDLNRCTKNPRGIAVVGEENYILRNRCSGTSRSYDVDRLNICHAKSPRRNTDAIRGTEGGQPPVPDFHDPTVTLGGY